MALELVIGCPMFLVSAPVDNEIRRQQIRDKREEMEQRLQEKIEGRMTQRVLTTLTKLQRDNPNLQVDQNMIAAILFEGSPDEDSSAPRATNKPIFGGSAFGCNSKGGRGYGNGDEDEDEDQDEDIDLYT